MVFEFSFAAAPTARVSAYHRGKDRRTMAWRQAEGRKGSAAAPPAASV